jgi:hypothetical protein
LTPFSIALWRDISFDSTFSGLNTLLVSPEENQELFVDRPIYVAEQLKLPV